MPTKARILYSLLGGQGKRTFKVACEECGKTFARENESDVTIEN
jgi:hypothetical protein